MTSSALQVLNNQRALSLLPAAAAAAAVVIHRPKPLPTGVQAADRTAVCIPALLLASCWPGCAGRPAAHVYSR
jgi:hypothetical protein